MSLADGAVQVDSLGISIGPTKVELGEWAVQGIEGICFPLSQVSPLVLEASSQWDEGTRAASSSSHAGYGTIRTTLGCLPAYGSVIGAPGHPE